MTDEDIQAVAKHVAQRKAALGREEYAKRREAFDKAIGGIDYFLTEEAMSLGGARYWIYQAQIELDRMLKALVAAEAATVGGNQ